MANYYYFIASLPMLHFDMKPPFSFQEFLKRCGYFLSEVDFKLISSLPEAGDCISKKTQSNVIKGWLGFDTLLRNELVKIRSSRRRLEPSRYLRGDEYRGQIIPHIALAAHRNTSVLEAEQFLDRERWDVLNGLEFGHYFDVDFLIGYAYKLKLLERWDIIRMADKEAFLEGVLQHG